MGGDPTMKNNILKAAALSLALVASGLVAFPTLALAQTKLVQLQGGQALVKVTHRTSQTLRTSQGFTDIVVGDPEVADAVPLTDRSIYVLGKKVGVTSVSLYDGDKIIGCGWAQMGV